MLNQITRGQLFFVIGTAKSGKSTWCNEWVKYNAHISDEWLTIPRAIVSDDDIRLALYNKRYDAACESMVFGIKPVMIKALISRGINVIVDDTHTTRESVKRIFEIDVTAKYKKFDTKPEVSKTRAISMGMIDLLPVIDRHWTQYCRMTDEKIEEIRKEVLSVANKQYS